MSKDLAQTIPTNNIPSPHATYVPPANPTEEPATTYEEIAAQMESKAANRGHGLGEVGLENFCREYLLLMSLS